MITNPYKILGVPDGASEEECTKAYKRLAKKYHPDLNPNDKEAERKMAEINAAYDQIKNGNASAQGQGQYSYSGYSSRTQQSNGTAPNYLNSAAQFIKSGQYQQAINLLNTIEDRNAQWYYLSALANMSVGNRAVAEDHIRSAYAKEPDNAVYRQAYEKITQGINPLDYNPFSSVFDFGGFEREAQQERPVYTTRRSSGCIGRIFRIIMIIIIIRLVLRLIMSAAYNRQQHYYQSQTPTTGYSQQYDYSQNNSDIFGESNEERQSL